MSVLRFVSSSVCFSDSFRFFLSYFPNFTSLFVFVLFIFFPPFFFSLSIHVFFISYLPIHVVLTCLPLSTCLLLHSCSSSFYFFFIYFPTSHTLILPLSSPLSLYLCLFLHLCLLPHLLLLITCSPTPSAFILLRHLPHSSSPFSFFLLFLFS